MSLSSNITNSNSKLTILFDDDNIIVIDKAPNVLSVPGKIKKFVKSRNDEWHDAIRYAASAGNEEGDPLIKACLERVAGSSTSIPRKEARFYSFLGRALKVTDTDLQRSIWTSINRCDEMLHKTLFDSIPEHLRSSADLAEQHCGHKLYHVHRLDMETSGVIMYAKTEDSCAELSRQFRDREVHKIYLAKVAAHFPTANYQEVITIPMRADLDRRPLQVVDHTGEGKPCKTHLQVIANNADGSDQEGVSVISPTALVKLMPITGRSHQLRVHMMAIGHPMLGDTLYAPPDVMALSPGRLCLHACALSFKHPTSGATVTFSSLHQCDFVDTTMKDEILRVLGVHDF